MDLSNLDNKDFWTDIKCLENVDVTQKNDKDKCTPLHFAVKHNAEVEIVKKLIDNAISKGVDIVPAKDTQDRQAIHYAGIHSIDKNIPELLIEYGAECNAQDEEDNTPFHLALQNHNHVMCLNYFIDKTDLNMKNVNGNNLLQESLLDSKNNRISSQLLLYTHAFGTEIYTNVNLDGYLAAHLAAKNLRDREHVSNIIASTMKKGNNELINHKSKKDETILMLAARYNTPEVLRFLFFYLDYGMDLHIVDKSGKTAYDYAELNEKLKDTSELNELYDYTKKDK